MNENRIVARIRYFIQGNRRVGVGRALRGKPPVKQGACSMNEEIHDVQKQRGYHAANLYPTEKADRPVSAFAVFSIPFELQKNGIDTAAIVDLFFNELLQQDFLVIDSFGSGGIVFFFHSRLGWGLVDVRARDRALSVSPVQDLFYPKTGRWQA